MLKPTTYKSPMYVLTKIVQMANMWNEFHWKFGNTSEHNYQNFYPVYQICEQLFQSALRRKKKKKIFILPVAV